MILNSNATVYIVNNTAVRYGGGILADDECTKGHYYTVSFKLVKMFKL